MYSRPPRFQAGDVLTADRLNQMFDWIEDALNEIDEHKTQAQRAARRAEEAAERSIRLRDEGEAQP